MTSHYESYKNTQEWQLIEKAIQDLMDNQDIQLLTERDYVVGYLTKQLTDNSPTEQ